MTDFTDVGVSHELKLQSTNIPTLSDADIIKKIWWFEDGMWDPGGLDPGGVYEMFRAGTDQDPGVYVKLFEIISSTYGMPLLAIDEGLVVQKDISAGGFLGSNQGELWLGSGRNDQIDVPKIVLGNSSVSRLQGGGPLDVPAIPSDDEFPAGENGQLFIYTPTSSLYKHNGDTWVEQGPTSNYSGYFDTLYLTKADASTPAHLDLGDLTVNGQLQLPEGGSAYGIVIGGDANLYRSATGILKTDGHFEAGSGALLYSICIGSARYGTIPYPYETIQLSSGHNLRFCFGTNERMKLTNSGRLELPVEGSTGGLRIGDVSLYRDSAYTLRLQNNLIVEGSAWASSLAVDNVVGVSSGQNKWFRAGTYLRAGHTSFGAIPYISFNAALTTSDIGTSTNEWTPDYEGSVWATMGVLYADAGTGTLHYRVYAHGTNGNPVNFSNFTEVFKLSTAGQLQLPVPGSDGGLKFGGDVNLYRSEQNVLKTDDSFVCNNIAGNDAIFNSVKGTYSGAAVKAGDYITLSWDGTYSNITAHNRHLMLNTDAGKGVYVYRDLLVNGKIYINSDPNILTSDDDMLFYKASGAGSYWFRRGTPGSYLDLFRLDNSGTAYFAGDVYVGGRRLYNDSGYLRCNSHVICDAALFVGTWANTTYAGPLYRNSSGQIGYNMSTLRHKKNVENVEDASWIYDLRVVEFDWNDEKRQSEEGRQFGLIAEEVNEICPKLVWKDKDALPEGVHYEWLGIPLLVEIKKLHQRVETLENQLKQNQTAA